MGDTRTAGRPSRDQRSTKRFLEFMMLACVVGLGATAAVSILGQGLAGRFLLIGTNL